jgi:CRISPR/Cas system endoribonuclease Cas6 (RAMP superfamily)
MTSKEDVLLEQHSITCKLCDAKFDSLGDMQHHVLTEHMQKGDYQIPLKEENGRH